MKKGRVRAAESRRYVAHPMKLWLVSHGYTQVWLADRLKPPVDPNLVYMWFARRVKPPVARMKQMAMLTRGDVSAKEIAAFYATKGILRSRRGGTN